VTVERMWSPMHLIIDARCQNQQVMTDKHLLSKWIIRLCHVIGMTPVGPVHTISFPFPGSDKPAISACQFLGESAIVAHPYPEFDYMYLDVFSCKEFDTEKAVEFIQRTLKVTESTIHLFQRGIDMETRAPVPLREVRLEIEEKLRILDAGYKAGLHQFGG